MKSNKKRTFFIIITLVFQMTLFSQVNSILNRNEVNSFDRMVMNPYSKSLDITGTVFEVVTLLTPATLLGANSSDYWKIGVEYAETMVLAYGAKTLAKFLVDRPRPYMYFDGAPQDRIIDGDWNNSFFSGHTTLAFAAAGFTTFMFCQYFPDSQWKFPVICGTYALALSTSICRLASGNHFMTDVITGAVVGSAIGYLVPFVNSFWLKPTFTNGVNVNISPTLFSVQVRF